MNTLTQFTQPAPLKKIGSRRITRLLEPFANELTACSIPLPPSEDDNDDYFAALAAALASTEHLPESLATTLLTLETAASPENQPRLDSAIDRRIPCVAISRDCALDRALELWFAAPDELSQFAPSPSSALPAVLPLQGERAQDLSSIGLAKEEEEAAATDSTIERFKDSTLPPINHSSSEVLPVLRSASGEGGLTKEDQLSPINHPDDPSTFAQLARLSPSEYDRIRKSEAKRLRVRQETLDAEVARCRSELALQNQANAVKLSEIEPWPAPVDGPEVLAEVASRFSLYIVLPPGAADALALWTAHTHSLAAFFLTPRLNLHSHHGGCGKTTTLDVLTTLTPRPLRAENLSAAVLFRLVHQHQPTLLLDEVDAYFHQAEELRGLLNAGHKRGACAYRCEGEGNTVRAFNAFAPAALAGIGTLPATLHDRSILIPLVPAQPGQVTTRFDQFHTETETVLARKIARWASDNYQALAACDPPLPPGAFNRVADNWRPLYAVAQVAGGDWPQRALAAFTHLACPKVGTLSTASQNFSLQPLAVSLLSDIRHIFAQTASTRISSQQLVDSLCALPDRPYSHPSALNHQPARLSRLLRPFGVHACALRIDGRCVRGFQLTDLAHAFARFLDHGPKNNDCEN